jgi:hypothetical protein
MHSVRVRQCIPFSLSTVSINYHRPCLVRARGRRRKHVVCVSVCVCAGARRSIHLPAPDDIAWSLTHDPISRTRFRYTGWSIRFLSYYAAQQASRSSSSNSPTRRSRKPVSLVSLSLPLFHFPLLPTTLSLLHLPCDTPDSAYRLFSSTRFQYRPLVGLSVCVSRGCCFEIASGPTRHYPKKKRKKKKAEGNKPLCFAPEKQQIRCPHRKLSMNPRWN